VLVFHLVFLSSLLQSKLPYTTFSVSYIYKINTKNCFHLLSNSHFIIRKKQKWTHHGDTNQEAVRNLSPWRRFYNDLLFFNMWNLVQKGFQLSLKYFSQISKKHSNTRLQVSWYMSSQIISQYFKSAHAVERKQGRLYAVHCVMNIIKLGNKTPRLYRCRSCFSTAWNEFSVLPTLSFRHWEDMNEESDSRITVFVQNNTRIHWFI